MEITAGGDVEVILGNFFASDDTAILLLLLPPVERAGDALDASSARKFLGSPFCESTVALMRKSLLLAAPSGLGLAQERCTMPGAVVL